MRGPGVAVDPGVGVPGAGDVVGLAGVVADPGVDGAGDNELVVPLGLDCVPSCESECDASRMATLSSATVNVTRRLKRITSTRKALVCTV